MKSADSQDHRFISTAQSLNIFEWIIFLLLVKFLYFCSLKNVE